MKMGATQELSPKSFLSRYTPNFALLSSCSPRFINVVVECRDEPF